MSYRCQRCHKPQPPRTAQNKLVIKTREKTYINPEGQTTGKGKETVMELKVCDKCFKAATKPKEQDQEQEQPKEQKQPETKPPLNTPHRPYQQQRR